MSDISEVMEFDVVIVGAGPAGLAAACRLMQLAEAADEELNVCVLEKGAEVGAHIISGAVFEPSALNELFPGWEARGAPLHTPVSRDELHFLLSSTRAFKVPHVLVPKSMHNQANYVISLENLCRWLGQQAEAMDVNVFAGFPAVAVLYNEAGEVIGVRTGAMGVDRKGNPKPNYQPGIDVHARYTIFAEGCRGHLGKLLMEKFNLQAKADPQHYGIGIKEIWRIDAAQHQPGLVVHTLGWPLDDHTEGGGFLYHAENQTVSLGFIVALNYRNPYLDPFEEMQRWKQHPRIRRYLEGASRLAYGARALTKGGFQSVPGLSFPGGVLAGCEAGFLNGAKIKGNHTAMKTGMLAAEAVFGALHGESLATLNERYRNSWVFDELQRARNFSPALARFGTLLGSAFIWLDQNLFAGKLPFTLHNRIPDHACLDLAKAARPINYPRPDGTISFDRLSSVYLSNTNHEEDQPCHLLLADPSIPIAQNLPLYAEPAQRYCPAAVYEVIQAGNGENRFQINAQNCVHCKTCDIKDPAQNITWVEPEGGGGPHYANM